MLHKLLKYDLKALYKKLLPFYILAPLCALVAYLLSLPTVLGLHTFLHYLLSFVSLAIAAGLALLTIISIWRHFTKHFYGTPAYLTQTLPVPRSRLYLSHILTSLIVITTSVLVCGLTLFFYILPHLYPDVFEFLFTGYAGHALFTPFNLGLLVLILVPLEFLFIVQCGYFGTIVSHRSTKHRKLLSLLAGFATYALGNALLLACLLFFDSIDGEIYALLHRGFIATFYGVFRLLGYDLLGYFLLNTALYLANLRLLRRLDVD